MASLTKIAKYKTGKNLSVELYQLCVTIIFALSHDDFLCNLALQDGRHLPLLKVAQDMKMTISQ